MGQVIVFPRVVERTRPRLPLGKPAEIIPFPGRWHGPSSRVLPEPPASEITNEPLRSWGKFIELSSKLWRGLKSFCQAVDRRAKAREPEHRPNLPRLSEGEPEIVAGQKPTTWSGDHPLAS